MIEDSVLYTRNIWLAVSFFVFLLVYDRIKNFNRKDFLKGGDDNAF